MGVKVSQTAEVVFMRFTPIPTFPPLKGKEPRKVNYSTQSSVPLEAIRASFFGIKHLRVF